MWICKHIMFAVINNKIGNIHISYRLSDWIDKTNEERNYIFRDINIYKGFINSVTFLQSHLPNK